MLNYAIIDVKYLEDIYAILNNMMKNLNLISRYDQQILKLLNQRNYDHNIFEAWKKVKFQIRSQSFTNKMQIIAAYREETSMKLNIPRRHFISDRDLVKLCQFLPTNDQDLLKIQLGHLRGINPKYKTELFNLCIGLNEYDEDTRN
jgi:ribonuclease D